MCYDILLHAVGNTLCVVILISMCYIPISMYYNSNLFYVMYFKFLCNYFLKFIVHKINSEIVKSKILVLTEREKANMADVDVG
jgi:hypothetical protein